LWISSIDKIFFYDIRVMNLSNGDLGDADPGQANPNIEKEHCGYIVKTTQGGLAYL